ncbi:MAG: acyl-CoA thioesterase [Cypionkella sp.]
MTRSFSKTFTASPAHIDELGHVNNAVWVTWIQDIATAHWSAVAAPEHVDRYVWVVTRHEIDYRGNIAAGESAFAETWIPQGPRGAQFDRCVEFRSAAGKRLVAARSTWAMLDKASGRLVRVPPEVAAPFLA